MMNTFNTHYGWGPGIFGGFGLVEAGTILFGGILVIVIIALKGYALWHAAKRDEKWWFAAMLVINTAGILELAYLIFVVKKWNLAAKSATIGANDKGNNPAPTDGSKAA